MTSTTRLGALATAATLTLGAGAALAIETTTRISIMRRTVFARGRPGRRPVRGGPAGG